MEKYKMGKNERRRRKFSDEQIRLLESMFQKESRPELRMKQQVANKIGLQPRQVAIWFQNKRARSKSRQTEQEYDELTTNYDDLSSRLESLKKENHTLLTQLQDLRNLAQMKGLAHGENSSTRGYENRTIIPEVDGGHYNYLSEAYNQKFDIPHYENSSASFVCLREDNELLDMRELPDDPIELADNRCSHESNVLLENMHSGLGWWKF